MSSSGKKEIKLKNPDYGIKRVYTELKVATVICASCMKTYPYCESCMHALPKENMCQLRQSRVCNELCHCQYCADREGVGSGYKEGPSPSYAREGTCIHTQMRCTF